MAHGLCTSDFLTRTNTSGALTRQRPITSGALQTLYDIGAMTYTPSIPHHSAPGFVPHYDPALDAHFNQTYGPVIHIENYPDPEYGRQRDGHYRSVQDTESVHAHADRLVTQVSQRLVPAMMSRSDRPMRVLMNYGNLDLEEGHSSTHDEFIFNGPGATVGPGPNRHHQERRPSSGVPPNIRSRSPSGGGGGWDNVRRRAMTTCPGCSKRRFALSSGVCAACDYLGPTNPRSSCHRAGDPPPYSVSVRRHVRIQSPERTRGRRDYREVVVEERDRDRERRDGETDGIYYCSDSDEEVGFR
ncbi:hypothetical protein B0H66DRAFT_617825 [Apodospora peruviana]|uniref:Uncharacterized protein n=1 Tax=Apodospora peruviana TaxID=516989 RepID=A0AAE0MCH4_9PEZI|nr:hypothetical protein B0H66DRAFT_617825 [Apodospora peruviana]